MPAVGNGRIVSPPEELIGLSRHLGDPAHDYAILGEGNTSADCGDGTFYVKASGSHLGSATGASFVRVHSDRVLAMLKAGKLSDEGILAALRAAMVDGGRGPLPSVETVVHAVCLAVPGVGYVGHTHPTAINAITCGAGFAKAASARLFPDHVVVCGAHSSLVPYTDPGLALARAVRKAISAFTKARGQPPRTIYLQNHGFIALGATARDVMNITAMAVKAARIYLGTFAVGGPRLMSATDIRRIDGRLDEDYRRRVIERRD